MTESLFVHYFICDCKRQLRAVTRSIVICPDCHTEHEIDPEHVRHVSHAPETPDAIIRKKKWIAWDMGAVEVDDEGYDWYV